MPPESLSALQIKEYRDIINSLFPEDIHGNITGIGADKYEILPDELALVTNATQKRINEFSAGRFCAHAVLSRLNITEQPILIGDDRAPVWPHGVTGSISHCRDLAGAVATTSEDYLGIGFDIENIKTTRNDISNHVCTVEEKNWLTKQKLLPAHIAVLLIFSIKESVYKCIYQVTQKRLGFQECNVTLNMDSCSARCSINSKRNDSMRYDIVCRFAITGQHIFSGTSFSNGLSGQKR